MARPFGPTIELSGARAAIRAAQREMAATGRAMRRGSVSALRKAIRSGKAAASAEIRKEIRLKKKVVDERIHTKVVSEQSLIATLTIRDKRVPLQEFMTPAQFAAQWRRQVARRGFRGVRVKPYKNRPAVRIPGGFVNIGRNSGRWHVMKRQDKSRDSARILFGPSIAGPLRKNLDAFSERANAVLAKNLAHEVDQALRRARGK